jgi:hypothetical protein
MGTVQGAPDALGQFSDHKVGNLSVRDFQDLGTLIRTRGGVEKFCHEAKAENGRPWMPHQIRARIEREYGSPDQDMRDCERGGHQYRDLRGDG